MNSQDEETNRREDVEMRETRSPVQENYYQQQHQQKNQIRILVAMAYGLDGYNYLEDWAVPSNFRKLLYPTIDHILNELDRRYNEMNRKDLFKPPRSGLNRQQAIRFLKKYPVDDEADVAFLKGKMDRIRQTIRENRRPRNSGHAWEILVQGIADATPATDETEREESEAEDLAEERVDGGLDEGVSSEESCSRSIAMEIENGEGIAQDVKDTAIVLLGLLRSTPQTQLY